MAAVNVIAEQQESGSAPGDERVLILAPVGRDATLLSETLIRAGFEVQPCRDIDVLCKEVRAEAGVVVLTTEALEDMVPDRLRRCIAEQPPWSDMSTLLLATAESAAHADLLCGALGNATVLERPVRVGSLVSTVRTALRARRRQYEVRELLKASECARQNAERQQAHIEQLNARLQRAMTETHHRVKNNLQIVAGMLDISLLDHRGSVPAAEVKRLGTHVRVLAAVHDLLTQQAKRDGQAERVSAVEMIGSLLPLLQRTAVTGRIRSRIDELPLSARQGTALALILNELVNNALKYGRGEVSVTLDVGDLEARLCVMDNGPGFPVGFDPVHAGNTGLELVEHLTRWDLGGETSYVTQEGGGGAACIVMHVARIQSMR